jgi:GTP cyclohydrolase I
MHARRLQQQQRMTEAIAHTIHDSISPRGVGVVVVAKHLCMMMRGVQKQNSEVITSAVLGHFRDQLATRTEFMSLLNGGAQ